MLVCVWLEDDDVLLENDFVVEKRLKMAICMQSLVGLLELVLPGALPDDRQSDQSVRAAVTSKLSETSLEFAMMCRGSLLEGYGV